MTQAPNNEQALRDFLYDYMDAMDLPDADPARLAHKYDLDEADTAPFIDLTERLDAAIVDIEPSRQFKQSLRQDLLGEAPTTMFGRLRNLSPRLQFAAGIALLAAMALLGRRRFLSEANRLWNQFRRSQSAAENATNGHEAQVTAQ